MMIIRCFQFLCLLLLLNACNTSNAEGNGKPLVQKQITSTTNTYSWLGSYSSKNSIQNRINVPEGFSRTKVEAGSFADWLRNLPLKEGRPSVKLYNGNLKSN